MINFLLFVFGTFFFTVAMINLLISWWLRSLFNKGRGSFSKRSYYHNHDKDHGSSYQEERSQQQTGGSAHSSHTTPQVMVSCAHCQTYCPKDSAIYQGGHYFCEQSHAELFEKK